MALLGDNSYQLRSDDLQGGACRPEIFHEVLALQINQVCEVLRRRGRHAHQLPSVLARFVEELLDQEYLIAVLDVELSNDIFPLHMLNSFRAPSAARTTSLSGAAPPGRDYDHRDSAGVRQDVRLSVRALLGVQAPISLAHDSPARLRRQALSRLRLPGRPDRPR